MEVIFEDKDIVVINKPAGMVVNKASSVSGSTVQQWLESHVLNAEKTAPSDWITLLPEEFSDQYGSPEEIYAERQGLVHRIDKDTSGILLLAKNPGSLLNLLAQFRQRTTQKEYLALVHGKLRFETGVVDAPLGRASRDRKTFAVRADGREAVTQYEVKEFYPHFLSDQWFEKIGSVRKNYQGNYKKLFTVYQGFSLVVCKPKTGRTHQIRVHMAHLQHPLVGDVTYVGKKRAKLDRLWCDRQFLHAHKLTFTHPRTREIVTFEAPLPADLQEALRFVSGG